MRPKFKVTYHTAQPSGIAAGYKYQTIKLDHGTSGSNGYRIEINGRLLAYSGDTEATAPLDALVEGTDVAIVEATGPGDVFSHMSWENAAELKRRHPKTRFMFNHLYSGTVEDAVNDFQVVEVGIAAGALVLAGFIGLGLLLTSRVANAVPAVVLAIAGAYAAWLVGVIVYG